MTFTHILFNTLALLCTMTKWSYTYYLTSIYTETFGYNKMIFCKSELGYIKQKVLSGSL